MNILSPLKCINILLILFSFTSATSQSLIGIGYGTYNVRGSNVKFKGFGPTLKYEYILSHQRGTVYLTASHYTHSRETEKSSKMEGNGSITYFDINHKQSYLYTQLGFKCLIGGDIDEKKLNPYIGGGLALAFANRQTIYSNTSTHNESISKRKILGVHLNTGVQYFLNPVIIELNGNIDLVTKPFDELSDMSYFIANSRLSVILPLFKISKR